MITYDWYYIHIHTHFWVCNYVWRRNNVFLTFIVERLQLKGVYYFLRIHNKEKKSLNEERKSIFSAYIESVRWCTTTLFKEVKFLPYENNPRLCALVRWQHVERMLRSMFFQNKAFIFTIDGTNVSLHDPFNVFKS